MPKIFPLPPRPGKFFSKFFFKKNLRKILERIRTGQKIPRTPALAFTRHKGAPPPQYRSLSGLDILKPKRPVVAGF
jgi:hypothetical protein